MSVMAILQDADKCMRCNGCVVACKREWGLKNFDTISQVIPQKSIVNPRQRLAIKSQKRVDMGPFVRFSCWHCGSATDPSAMPPCAKKCPTGAIKKEATGAVSVDKGLCDPDYCDSLDGVVDGRYPCVTGCQRGGYPKVGFAYEDAPTTLKMNKCTLCHGRAGVDDPAIHNMLPTRATAAEIAAVPEKAHEPACVSSCPAKAMKWDTRDNILAYLRDPANGYKLTSGPAAGTNNWIGNGSMYWASRKVLLAPPKADPFIEDHVLPMASSMMPGARLVLPTLVIGGLAALSARRSSNEKAALTSGEVQG